MVLAKLGNHYVSGECGDDDGHIFALHTEDRNKAKRFKDSRSFRIWADDLSDPETLDWLDYSKYLIVAAGGD